jgi:hypothetical protein
VLLLELFEPGLSHYFIGDLVNAQQRLLHHVRNLTTSVYLLCRVLCLLHLMLELSYLLIKLLLLVSQLTCNWIEHVRNKFQCLLTSETLLNRLLLMDSQTFHGLCQEGYLFLLD